MNLPSDLISYKDEDNEVYCGRVSSVHSTTGKKFCCVKFGESSIPFDTAIFDSEVSKGDYVICYVDESGSRKGKVLYDLD